MIMVFGVIAFSFANGSLASIMQNYDQHNAGYQEKLVTLNKIYKDYCLPLDLFIKIKKSLGYENKKDINELTHFLDTLPHKLKTEVSLYVYESRYENIKFFKNRSVSFILWMCPLLRPQIYNENQFFFQENEVITEVFFLIKGKASFVLPRYKNTSYINIKNGNHFGVIDIVGSAHTQNIDMKEWYH